MVWTKDYDEPDHVLAECFGYEQDEEQRQMVEKFMTKVQNHRQEHDLTSYLGWAHDVVWGFTINTLR